MEGDLLGADPSALLLGEREYGDGHQEPEAQTRDESGHQADVHFSGSRSLLTATLITVVAVVQLVWVALLVYGAYWVAVRLPL
jgi:hypothetical protein